MNTRYLLFKINLLHYIRTVLLYHVPSLSLIIPFFQNCWGLFAKYFSRFLFRLRIGAIYHEKNFLITGTSNNRIEQDLKSTEDTIECPNQTVTAFLLQSMQYTVLHCHNGFFDLPILTIFLL